MTLQGPLIRTQHMVVSRFDDGRAPLGFEFGRPSKNSWVALRLSDSPQGDYAWASAWEAPASSLEDFDITRDWVSQWAHRRALDLQRQACLEQRPELLLLADAYLNFSPNGEMPENSKTKNTKHI